jgi:hypothetical protein
MPLPLKYGLLIVIVVTALAAIRAITSGSTGVGVVLLIPLAGLIFFYFSLKSDMGPRIDAESAKELKTRGHKVMTTFKAVDRKWNISINGQSPIVVYTQDDTGRTYESEQLWFSGADSAFYDDPRFKAWQTLQSADPDKKYRIPVYINPTNSDEYYMDLSDVMSF